MQTKYSAGKPALRVNDGIAHAGTTTSVERDSSPPNIDPVVDNAYSNPVANAILLDSSQLMDKILQALANNEPLSVVSVGQTEAFVMAQYGLYSEQEFMRHREAYNANLGQKSGFLHRGIRFPNPQARDDTVEAVRKAHIIGYNTIEENARRLTEQVFSVYGINPKWIYEANIRRVFMYSQAEKFESMLQNRKVLLIGSLAPEAKVALEMRYKGHSGLNIVGAIPIFEYEEIPRVKDELANCDFDLCLIAAGVNAVILASHIAEKYGKVAFDIGWGMQALITDQVVSDSFITDVIGLENLFRM